jgi:hypothetical protein
METSAEELKEAVEHMHHCKARVAEVVPVSETFQGQPVWQGLVHIFKLTGHPTATRCYAWSSPVEGSDKRRFFAALHIPPITSAQDAVRASIVQEYRKAPPGKLPMTTFCASHPHGGGINSMSGRGALY